MRKLRALVAALVVAGTALSAQQAQGATATVRHYPDLRTLEPSDLHIARQCTLLILGTCRRSLRFSNTVWNAGDGRLEMRPQNNAQTGRTTAYQRIFTHDATGAWSVAEEVPVGEFSFHTGHAHWHFEGFANYSLVNENADGSIGNNVRRSSQKTTFCVIDTDRVSTTLEHAGAQTYTRCGQTDATGLSVGWGDKYGYTLDGQSIDLAGIPDGRYWLVSTADFQNRLRETDDSNNWAAVKIQISGSSVTRLGARFPA